MTQAVMLKPVLAAPASWYAAMVDCDLAVIDGDRPFDKRDKAVHRFAIADVRGRLDITVPVCHGTSVAGRRPTWNDILVSDHNRWWLTAASTLETAYGGTPWFHDLWPRFRHLFTDAAAGRPVLAYMLDMDAVIRATIGIKTRLSVGLPIISEATSLGKALTVNTFDEAHYPIPAYRQVREAGLSFIPGLSVLDALFNLGPRDTLALLKAAQSR